MQAPKKTGRALIEEINACRPPNGHLAFWWLGQLGYAIKVGTAVFYVDAYLTPDKNRCEPPPLRPEDVTNADYIIASHDHLDHLDRRAWPAMAAASPNARFLVPALIAQKGHSVSREAAPGCAVQTLAQELGIPRHAFSAFAPKKPSPLPALARMRCACLILLYIQSAACPPTRS